METKKGPPMGEHSTQPNLPSTLDFALSYLHRGWSIIPVGVDKRPLSPWEELQHRLPVEQEVRKWYRRFPNAGVGIVCGEVSGILVLDIDPRHHGDLTLLKWADEGKQVPPCPEAKTGGGGCHFYLAQSGGGISTIPALGEGVDLKAEGSYVVAPPSLHPSGQRYMWFPEASPEEVPLPQPPAWLLELLRKNRAERPVEGKPNGVWRLLLSNIPEGQRNETLTSIAGWLHLYHPPPVVRAILLAVNLARCIPPLELAEIDRIVTSISRYKTPGIPGHPRAVVADFTRREANNG